MINANNDADVDRESLAMLCGVVPPEYREGTKHQFLAVSPANPATMNGRDGTEPAHFITPPGR